MPRGIPNKKRMRVSPGSAKGMSPEEYERHFGRRKPGPTPGFKRKGKRGPKPKAAIRAERNLAYERMAATHERKKPGPKPGLFKTAAPRWPAERGLKKDGTPRAKPGPKPGGHRKASLHADPVANGEATTGRLPSKKANIASELKTAGKDLGSPPKKMTLGAITQAALELKNPDLETLLERIEEKLAGDTRDITPDEWGAVEDLIEGGQSRLGAIRNIRMDRAKTATQGVAMTAEQNSPTSEPSTEEREEVDQAMAEDEEGEEEDEEEDEEENAEEVQEAPATASPR